MKKIIAANWKMHKTAGEAKDFVAKLAVLLKGNIPAEREIIIFPSFLSLSALVENRSMLSNVCLGAQNFYPETHGAYTGEISPVMLEDLKIDHVLAGHSERRHIFNESNDLVAKKTVFAMRNKFKTMLCVGETLEERENGKLNEVLKQQLGRVFEMAADDSSIPFDQLLSVAYEPVWAIGTGKVAGPDEVLEAHATLRSLLVEHLGPQGREVPILYGGSVKPDNAHSLLDLDNVDGLLVGGASLVADSFYQIIVA